MKPSALFALIVGHLCSTTVVAQIYSERCLQCIDIDVYFHTVSYNNSTYLFNDRSYTQDELHPMIEANVAVLNHEFNATPFFFVWKNINEQIPALNSSVLTQNMCSHYGLIQMHDWSFFGEYGRTLNVYLGHSLQGSTQGCATFPNSKFVFDGITFKFTILPPEGNGLTLAHEVGHWLGLHHTFEAVFSSTADPCDPQNPGDLVDDTAGHTRFRNYTTNQTSWDSCPDQEGEDPFWNIMNSICSGRRCYQDRAEFTNGQIDRMYDTWLVLREQHENCTDSMRLFELDILQHGNNHQSILFDNSGDEVYNLRHIYNADGVLDANLCLYSDMPYAAVFYLNDRRARPYTFEYKQDGEIVATSDDVTMVPLAGLNITSSLLLPYGAAIELPMDIGDINELSNIGSDCDPLTEARLEVIVNGTVWSALFDATSQGMALNGTRYCLPKGRHYSLVTYFDMTRIVYEELSLVVTLDGRTIYETHGKFFNYFVFFPRMVSTIITPRMLNGVDAGPTMTGSPVTFAPAAAFPTAPLTGAPALYDTTSSPITVAHVTMGPAVDPSGAVSLTKSVYLALATICVAGLF